MGEKIWYYFLTYKLHLKSFFFPSLFPSLLLFAKEQRPKDEWTPAFYLEETVVCSDASQLTMLLQPWTSDGKILLP